MGGIQDRTKEHLCATDKGIVMTRRMLLNAAKAASEGKPVPATDQESQRVRSVSIELAAGRLVHARRQARALSRAGDGSAVGVSLRAVTPWGAAKRACERGVEEPRTLEGHCPFIPSPRPSAARPLE